MTLSSMTTISKGEPLIIVSMSDLHLGHSRVSAAVMTDNYRKLIFPQLEGAHLLIIAGDLFDALITLVDAGIDTILLFLSDLLWECCRHNVAVRVLRGTVSHDRTQAFRLITMSKSHRMPVDIGYFDKIAVEYIEHLDLKLLYLPDDLPFSSSDAVMDVAARMIADAGWDAVDYAVVHGCFREATPVVAQGSISCLYNTGQFQHIVKRHVLVGHIHTAYMFGGPHDTFAIQHGSTERLTFGDEVAKGIVRIEDRRTSSTVTFVENTRATPFVTVDASFADTDEAAVALYNERTQGLEGFPLVYVRIKHQIPERRQALTAYAKQKHPNFIVTRMISVSDPALMVSTPPVRLHQALVPPTKETLADAIVQFYAKRGTVTAVAHVEQLLKKHCPER